ncbi:hypothetical protein [Deinococcus altitudinis]|uniref:hypothetical protein n=1 Tax=Deinococcus altitudinis TaxID=468914 RepID=UPI003892857F
MSTQRPALRRVFLLISLTALCITAVWSTSIDLRESRHTGEPLPVVTLAQLAAQPDLVSPVHLQGAVPQFGRTVVQRHGCYRTPCVYTLTPLYDAAHPVGSRVAVLSLVRTFPGDVNEARHPFDPRDPVIEGEIEPDGLYPGELQDLRARGVPADDATVLFLRRAFNGRVPPADSVDVLIPWLIGLPVTLVTALIALTGLRPRQRQI